MSTDKDWEKWGKQNPYFGVCTDDKFKGHKLEDVQLDELYRSGELEIAQVVQYLKDIYGPITKFEHAVDYGSGVGRLSCALSKYSKRVTGLDVAPAMIKRAKDAAKLQKLKNVSFYLTDSDLSKLPKIYDFAYSFIVFQHINPKVGKSIIEDLVYRLNNGGYFALHVTYKLDRTRYKKMLLWLRQNVFVVRWIANLARNRPVRTPNMRMYMYNLNEVTEILRQNGAEDLHLKYTQHGDYLGVYIFGRKQL